MAEKKYISAIMAAETISDKLNIPLPELVDIFAEIPAADVAQVKHGKWEKVTHEWTENKTFGTMSISGTYPTCSICGAFETGLKQNTRYCPNCGAKMDGE